MSDAIDFKALAAPFPAADLEWRIQQAGVKNGRPWAICVPYVTNRAIQQRLDDVAGPANWRNGFQPGPSGGVVCCLLIRVNGEWIAKCDGASNPEVESVKGGLSAAMKRAAVQWGIGRYLYGVGDLFARVHDDGRLRGKVKRQGEQDVNFRWDPPALPAHLLPERPGPQLVSGNGRPPAPPDREPVSPGEHEAMVDYLRSVGPQADDGAEIRIQRKTHNLRAFVRENWQAIKEQPQIAKAVVQAVETATGTSFAGFVETGECGKA